MEWNAKSPSQWDWEHVLFNAKATENPKLQQTDWSGEADREINVGLFYPSGGSGCSGSELIHASSSRSSKSASINSSSNGDSKASIFTFEGSQEDSSGKKEMSKEEPVGTSSALEPSFSGEPLLSLKLGKRLYFEDVCPGSDTKNPSLSGVPKSYLSAGKKSKSNSQSSHPTCCQVEGCNLDLSAAKDYHRKHRVCESHSKSPKVVVGGLERRFCQQCSRFHGLSEFDEKKRSCRRRLSDHNARRRKPHSEAIQLNPSACLSSSTYDGGQQMSPFAYSRAASNFAWQDTCSTKLPQTKDFPMKPAKAGVTYGRVLQPFDEIPSNFTMLSDNSSCVFTSKGLAAKTINPGIEDSLASSELNAGQDFQSALSLLSTNSWGSYETKSISPDYSNHTTRTGLTQLRTHSMSQPSPLASSEYWQTVQQPNDSRMSISYLDCDDNNRFQNFQLFRAPYQSGFSCNQSD